MSDVGLLKKRLNEYRLRQHHDVVIPDIVYDLIDEARKDLEQDSWFTADLSSIGINYRKWEKWFGSEGDKK